MNDSPVAKQQPQAKIKEILNFQADLNERGQREHKALYGLIERLDAIANRINSNEYPKNFPKDDSAKPGNDKHSDPPTRPDGLVGHLIQVNENDSSLLDELSYKIIPNFETAINYLEQHI